MREYKESKTTQTVTATVRHVTSSSETLKILDGLIFVWLSGYPYAWMWQCCPF